MCGKKTTIFVLVVLAFGVTAVSSASAAQYHSTSASGTTYIGGSQIGIGQFDLENGANVKCTSVVSEGAIVGTTASEITGGTLTLTQCTASGQTTTINTAGCRTTATEPTTTGGSDNWHAVVHLVCEAGQKVIVSVGDPTVTCTITIHPQTPASPLADLENVTGSPKDILVKSTLSGIAYTSSGSVCGANGMGTLTGTGTAKAYSDVAKTKQVDLWIA